MYDLIELLAIHHTQDVLTDLWFASSRLQQMASPGGLADNAELLRLADDIKEAFLVFIRASSDYSIPLPPLKP